jgi:hypothetical protein
VERFEWWSGADSLEKTVTRTEELVGKRQELRSLLRSCDIKTGRVTKPREDKRGATWNESRGSDRELRLTTVRDPLR